MLSSVDSSVFVRIWRIAVVAFSSGTIVMALEIAGSRLLTPIFGSSTYTWGILIGIILSGLTIGYHIGGRIADSNPSFQKLCSVVFSTGIFILFVP
ncbi:MAG: spermidine synthase, partial [Nitrosopumilaceae archaeon]|nr:spermidine synthase [Nitrosopumilaceae archaeon]NIV64593.1 spermidine synthase [Nitrosopumilaceae archaeon]NIX59987.1 spermidine synthase [Nitrosopumilaceae archaeon]